MDSYLCHWIQVWEDTLSKWKGWIRLFKRESGSTCFGAKMVPCLWRADLSFMNSVTGSGNVAKCSNILQDKIFLYKYTYLYINIRFKIDFDPLLKDVCMKSWEKCVITSNHGHYLPFHRIGTSNSLVCAWDEHKMGERERERERE